MTNFFASPQILPVSNYEPPGDTALRDSLMNQIGARQINPYGLNAGQQGGTSYNPYQGRGTFNPYTGQMSGGYGGSSPNYGGQGGGNPSNPWAGGGGYQQNMGQMGGGYNPGAGATQSNQGQQGPGMQAPPMGESQNQVGPGMGSMPSPGAQTQPAGAPQGPTGSPGGGGGNVSALANPNPYQGSGSGSDSGQAGGGNVAMSGMQNAMQQQGQGQKSSQPAMAGSGGPPSAANNFGGVGQSAYNIWQQLSGQGGSGAAPGNSGMTSNAPGAGATQSNQGVGINPGQMSTGGNPQAQVTPVQKGMAPGPAQLDPQIMAMLANQTPGQGSGFNTNATQANAQAPQSTHPGGTSMMTMPQVAQMIQGQPDTSNPGAATMAAGYNNQRPNQIRYNNQSWDGVRYDAMPGGYTPSMTPTGGTGGPAYTGPSWSQPGGGQDAAQQGVDARQAGAMPPPTPQAGDGPKGGEGQAGVFNFNSPTTQYDATPASTAGSTDPSLIMKLMQLLHLATGGSAAQGTAPVAASPTPTPVPMPPPVVNPNPQNTTKGGTNLQTTQTRANDIENNNDGIKYDGSDPQPYPDESSPQPYDGSPMGMGAGMHIHAPMAQVHPQGVPNAAPPGLNQVLGGMASANRHGQMAAYRAGKPGVVYDGGNPTPGQVGGAAPSPSTSSNPSTSGAPAGSVSAMPSSAQTAGASMYPWMQSYQGNLTAPMSNEQNQALSQQSNFAGSNPLSAAGNYNQQLLSGAFLPANNANVQQIESGMQGTKNAQDALAQRQIAASMAAGGNALSGANAAAQAQYLNQSNNNYNTTTGQLQYNNLQNEQALQNQGVGQAEGLTSAQSGLNQSLMNMGSVPQQLAQSNDTAQYQDWLRQVGAMQTGDQQNTTNAMNLLKINPGGAQPQYGTSQASSTAALLSSLLGGSGGTGGVLGSLISALTGGKSAAKTPGSGGGGGAPSAGGAGGKPGTASSTTDANGNPVPTDANGNPMTAAGTDANGYPIYTDSNGQYYESVGGMTVPMQGMPSSTGDLGSFLGGMNPVDDSNSAANGGNSNGAIDTSGGLDSGGDSGNGL